MRIYNLEELEKSLFAVGVKPADTLLIHSALFVLGRIHGEATSAYPALIYDTIRKIVGPEGTIVVPTFTFEFCRGRPFHRQLTPSQGMGNLSEYVRTLPGAHRSPHPMQSVAAVGPNAEPICRPDTSGAFDVRGAFSMLLERDAKLLLLGCGFVATSLIHYAEERVGVPYRRWKNFTGVYRDGDCESIRTYSLYARDLVENPNIDPTPIGERLLKKGRACKTYVGSGPLECTSCRDFVEMGVEILRHDRRGLSHRRGRL